MQNQDLTGTTALVTGAGRGFGRAVATALAGAGARVVGVARTAANLDDLREELGDRFVPVAADVADPDVARALIGEYRPETLVLNAGAQPAMGALHTLTWADFSRNWEVDTRQAFEWLTAALLLPLAPGSLVITVSSGAALRGSPISGGYAGAKATVRFLSDYAAQESARAGLGVRFVALLPQLTPATELGQLGVAGYAADQGVDVATFVERLAPILTPKQVGESVVELALASRAEPEQARAYLLTAGGLQVLN